MEKFKLKRENIDLYIILLVLSVIVITALFCKDSYKAVISAICGISYVFLAGKGNPVCYLIGVTGSFFYCWIAYNNLLWGNLLLYALYYIPMQIIGFFKWNKNLKSNKKEIIKIKLSVKERIWICVCCFVGIVLVFTLLLSHKDAHPLLDSFTTVFSIAGMYLTVRRAIEQWIVWLFVNVLSFIMWLLVAMHGVKVYSTVMMWAVYIVLAFYFFHTWNKEINSLQNQK